MRVVEGASGRRPACPLGCSALATSRLRTGRLSHLKLQAVLPGSQGPLSAYSRSRQHPITCSASLDREGSDYHATRAQEVAQLAAAPQRLKPKKAGEEVAKAATEVAQGLDVKLGVLKKAAKEAYDRIYYGDVLPPIGSFQLSYARMLQLLSERKIKRIILLSDGRAAIVEIPVEGLESDYENVYVDRRNHSVVYAEEVPEWKMEKNRYYVELPGDVWEEGTLMHLIRDNQEKRVYINGEVRVPYTSLLEVGQVRPELQVVDPGDAYVFLNEYSSQFLPILGLLGLRLVVGAGDWVLRKLGREKKSAQEELAEELGRHRAKEYNIEGGKKGVSERRSTGVTYDDVAGIDHIKADVQEILNLLLGDEDYKRMGAHPIRGVLLEGPPGTGKTLLAKAMAGEAGIPFYSANGAEFVEMFQGVAAARIRSLFKAARKNAPAIIFIDEIDAIGKARSTGPKDSGTQEREQGLLQLLTEMDGFYQNDKVVVVGATNRKDSLDDALLRPGRFDRTLYMGRPSPANRLRILQVHVKNKPIDRSNDDELLRQIAELTIGFSGAELANLLNEAAILAVRKSQATIDLSILKEAMDKVRLGLPHESLPDSAAKRQYATVEAARAVVCALTPGLPPIEHISIRPRGETITRILFERQEFRKDGGTWHLLATPGHTANAVELEEPLSLLEQARALLVPMYASRAAEEVVYGRDAVSLSTAKEVSKAGELARWIVMDAKLHPAMREDLVSLNLRPGGNPDPTVQWRLWSFDDLILDLQRRAYEDALRIVASRRTVIETVGRELCENSDETVSGSRIVELLRGTPLDEVPAELAQSSAPRRPAAAPQAAAAAAAVSGSSNGSSNGAPRLSGDGVDAVLAAAASGAASSSGNGAAEDGNSASSVAEGDEPEPNGDEVARRVLGDDIMAQEQLVKLAEVVMGKVAEWELMPGSVAASKAERVRQQLLDPEQRARLEAIRRYRLAPPGDGTPPPPPPPPPEELAPAGSRYGVGQGLEMFDRDPGPSVFEL